MATTDGGAIWQRQSVPPGISALYELSCPSTTVCTAVGGSPSGPGAIITTTNGGTTWTGETRPDWRTRWTQQYHFVPVGHDLLRHQRLRFQLPAVSTTDGGTTWTSETPPSNLFLYSISCPSNTVCTAIGSDAASADIAVVGTTDGGTTWASETLPSSLSGPVGSELDISCPSSNFLHRRWGGSRHRRPRAFSPPIGRRRRRWDGQGAHRTPAPACLTGVSCSVAGAPARRSESGPPPPVKVASSSARQRRPPCCCPRTALR